MKNTGSFDAKSKESDVYDRQIRLWGGDAQAKMAKARVLYIHITATSSEVMKNLVLAGIRAVLCDCRPIPEAIVDVASFFLSAKNFSAEEPLTKKPKFGTVAEAVKASVENLNPLLGECEIVNQSPAELSNDFVSQFTIVVASRLSMAYASRISKAVTNAGGKFFMADCFGMFGACAMDLGPHYVFRTEFGKEVLQPTKLPTYVPLDAVFRAPLSDAVNRFHKTPPPTWIRYRCILEYVRVTNAWPSAETADHFANTILSWIHETAPSLKDHEIFGNDGKELRDLARIASSEVAPVCGVLGGLIGNEVIKVISGKGEPANNTILLDGFSCKAWSFLVQPKL